MTPISEHSDQTLLADFATRRDEASFGEFVKRHHEMAYATAYRLCGNRAEAQDILQQSLIVLARRANEVQWTKCPAAWLHRVVVLEARKSWRKNHNRRKREMSACQNYFDPVEGEANYREVAFELDESLNLMSEKDREVLTLHYLENKTFREIAAERGGNHVAWQKRSIRALAKLSEILKRRGVSMPAGMLGGVLVSLRLDVLMPAAKLKELTATAIMNSMGAKAGLAGPMALALSMKIGIAIGAASGVVLALGWAMITTESPGASNKTSSSAHGNGANHTAAKFHERDHRGFTLEMVQELVTRYDRTEESDSLQESRLLSLMFLVPEKHLEDVFQMLLETEDHEKFEPIAAALFGCWAEFDPAAAHERAQHAGVFSYQARQGAIVTWLNQEVDAALEVILAEKSRDHQRFITQYLRYECERDPSAAAKVVDSIAEAWPEMNEGLFRMVAESWSHKDALAAGEWIASCPDEELRTDLLKRVSVTVAKTRGLEGLAITDHITDPELRQRARFEAVHWWGISSGGESIMAGESGPARDISGGFPADWSLSEIRSFCHGTMVNYPSHVSALLELAEDDEQRMSVYTGAFTGSTHSDPSTTSMLVENIPDDYFQKHEYARNLLGHYIREWQKKDPDAAREWLSQQQPGLKTDIMREVMNQEDTP